MKFDPLQSHVAIKIFNIVDREAAMPVIEKKEPGNYSVQWNASAMTSGINLYRGQTGAMVNLTISSSFSEER